MALNTDHIVNYLAAAMANDTVPDYDTTFNFITYGLYGWQTYLDMAELDVPAIVKLCFSVKDGLYTQGLLHAHLLRLIRNSPTLQEAKKAIINYNAELSASIKPYTSAQLEVPPLMDSFLKHLIVMVSRVKGSTGVGNETSVITGSAIIAPYQGVLKKPFVGEFYEDDEEEAMEALDNRNPRTTILNEMIIMYLDHDYLDILMSMPDIFGKPLPNADSIMHIIGLTSAEGPMAPIYNYYAWAYLYLNYPKMVKKAVLGVLDAISNITTVDSKDLIGAVYRAEPANEEALLDELEQLDALREYSSFTPFDLNTTDADTDPLQVFNLTPLMNYIYTNRRFRSNYYVRSRYMTMKNISSYVIYKEFFIIIPRDEDNVADYIYVPVIDDMNNSEVVIIKYSRSGDIKVLSEAEYDEEIGNMS